MAEARNVLTVFTSQEAKIIVDFLNKHNPAFKWEIGEEKDDEDAAAIHGSTEKHVVLVASKPKALTSPDKTDEKEKKTTATLFQPAPTNILSLPGFSSKASETIEAYLQSQAQRKNATHFKIENFKLMEMMVAEITRIEPKPANKRTWSFRNRRGRG